MGYHDNCSQPAMFSSSVHSTAHDRAKHTWGTLTSPTHTHSHTPIHFVLRDTPAGACRVRSYHGNSIYRCGIAESTVREWGVNMCACVCVSCFMCVSVMCGVLCLFWIMILFCGHPSIPSLLQQSRSMLQTDG